MLKKELAALLVVLLGFGCFEYWAVKLSTYCGGHGFDWFAFVLLSIDALVVGILVAIAAFAAIGAWESLDDHS